MLIGQSPVSPDEINFVRQGVKRLIFDPTQGIPLASLEPSALIGLSSAHPYQVYSSDEPVVAIEENQLIFQSTTDSETIMWLGGFNPFATYLMEISEVKGVGELGFEFRGPDKREGIRLSVFVNENYIQDAQLTVFQDSAQIAQKSIFTHDQQIEMNSGTLILQLFGSGLNLFIKEEGSSPCNWAGRI